MLGCWDQRVACALACACGWLLSPSSHLDSDLQRRSSSFPCQAPAWLLVQHPTPNSFSRHHFLLRTRVDVPRSQSPDRSIHFTPRSLHVLSQVPSYRSDLMSGHSDCHHDIVRATGDAMRHRSDHTPSKGGMAFVRCSSLASRQK